MDLAIELPLGDSQSQALLRSEEGVVTKNIDHLKLFGFVFVTLLPLSHCLFFQTGQTRM